MKFTLQDCDDLFADPSLNPGMTTPPFLFHRVDMKTVTGRHVLEPLLHSIPRLYSEHHSCDLRLLVLLSAVRSLFSRNLVAKSSHANLRCPMVGQGALFEHQAEEQLHWNGQREACSIAVGTITGRNSPRSVLIMELVSA
jgi:hypothetical protein